MKKYDKPVLEVIELRPEERLAQNPSAYTVTKNEYDGDLDFIDSVIVTNNATKQSWFGVNILESSFSDWLKLALKKIGL